MYSLFFCRPEKCHFPAVIREVSVGDIASRHPGTLADFHPDSRGFVDVIADMMEKDPKRRLHCR